MASVADGSPRVLIADDDALVRWVMRAALEGDGWSVVEAESGSAAIRELETIVPDVAVVDAHMPGSDLAQLLEHMNALSSPPPVIVVSGAPVAAEVLRSYRGGRSRSVEARYLAKPVDLSTLRDAVQWLATANRPTASPSDGSAHAES